MEDKRDRIDIVETLDPAEISNTQLKKLTESDFPETNLQFTGNNLILRKP